MVQLTPLAAVAPLFVSSYVSALPINDLAKKLKRQNFGVIGDGMSTNTAAADGEMSHPEDKDSLPVDPNSLPEVGVPGFLQFKKASGRHLAKDTFQLDGNYDDAKDETAIAFDASLFYLVNAPKDPIQGDPSGITDFSTDTNVFAQVPLYNTQTQQAELHCLTYPVTDDVQDDLLLKKCGEIDSSTYSQEFVYDSAVGTLTIAHPLQHLNNPDQDENPDVLNMAAPTPRPTIGADNNGVPPALDNGSYDPDTGAPILGGNNNGNADNGAPGAFSPANNGAPGAPAPTDNASTNNGAPGAPGPANNGAPASPAPTDNGVPGAPAPSDNGAPASPAPTDNGVPGAPAPSDNGAPASPAPTDNGVPGAPAPDDNGNIGSSTPAPTGNGPAPSDNGAPVNSNGNDGSPAPAPTDNGVSPDNGSPNAPAPTDNASANNGAPSAPGDNNASADNAPTPTDDGAAQSGDGAPAPTPQNDPAGSPAPDNNGAPLQKRHGAEDVEIYFTPLEKLFRPALSMQSLTKQAPPPQ